MNDTRAKGACRGGDNPLPRTVIVVGATGFIGRNLVARLRGEAERIVPVSASRVAVDGIPGARLADLAASDIGPGAALVNVAAHRYDASQFAAAQAEILLRNVELAG